MRAGRRRSRWGFEVRVDGRLVVRLWGEERVDRSRPESPRIINTWREYRFEEWEIPGRPVRAFAQLRATQDLQPVSYASLNEYGQPIWAMNFTAGAVTAHHADGTELTGSVGSADFLMETNGLVHLGAKLVELVEVAKIPYAGSFFSPEALEAVPYCVQWESPGRVLRTNLDELITVSGARIVRMTRPDIGFEATACDLSLPRWPLRDRLGMIAPPPTARARRSYAPPSGVRASEGTTLTKGGSTLGYTLVEPIAARPRGLAVFCGGSGSHDRHGHSFDLDLGYHQLLDQLCRRHRLSNLRFDKRGTGDTPLGGDVLEYGFEGLLDDAQRCLDLATDYSRDAGIPLLAIGHSEGGQVVLGLANSGNPQINGVILLATTAQPIDQVITDQVRRRCKELGMTAAVTQAQVDELEEFFNYVRHCDSSEWTRGEVPDRVLVKRRQAPYYRQLLEYNSLRLIAQLRQPVLILHGTDDQQVPPRHAHQLAEAAHASGIDTTLVMIPRTNHLLKSSSVNPSIADYYDRRRPAGMAPAGDLGTAQLTASGPGGGVCVCGGCRTMPWVGEAGVGDLTCVGLCVT
ncbi:MAG: alpha/beta hydrolase, partial [Pseudonocardiaceae bacterium]